MKLTDSLLISIDFSQDKDNTVMVVGRKPVGKPVDIINAFQGEEAIDIWKKLTTVKEKHNENK